MSKGFILHSVEDRTNIIMLISSYNSYHIAACLMLGLQVLSTVYKLPITSCTKQIVNLGKDAYFQSVFENPTCEISLENKSKLEENKIKRGEPVKTISPQDMR